MAEKWSRGVWTFVCVWGGTWRSGAAVILLPSKGGGDITELKWPVSHHISPQQNPDKIMSLLSKVHVCT